MWDALRMDGVAHEPTTAPSVFNGEWAVLSTTIIAMDVLSLVERPGTLLSHVKREIKDRQSEKLICKTCHSLTTDQWKRPGKALFGGRVLPGLR
jgi:hypothetical protein